MVLIQDTKVKSLSHICHRLCLSLVYNGGLKDPKNNLARIFGRDTMSQRPLHHIQLTYIRI